jgi:two-component system LytT family response regulator
MKRTLTISNKEKTCKIPLDEIIFIASKGMKITVYTINGNKYSCCKNIGAIEEKLKEEKMFVRPHTSYLINLLNVQEYNKADGGKIIMVCGTEIIPTRRRKPAFLEAYAN